MLPQFEVNCSLQLKTKVHCMPFGQSCMCLDPMLIVFSFLIKTVTFSYTLEYENIGHITE